MNSLDALLRVVLERRDELAPRKVYADALLEAGDERGEFIAVQCDLAALLPDDPRREQLLKREAELLEGFSRARVPVDLGCLAALQPRKLILNRTSVTRAQLEVLPLAGLRRLTLFRCNVSAEVEAWLSSFGFELVVW